jgi:predicted transposase/invertase (TIGR01784 family)
LLEILIKHINARDFANAINVIVNSLKVALDAEISQALLNSAFSYLMYAKESDEIQQLIGQINTSIPNLEENVMTYAKELIQKGRQEGRQQSQLEIARNLLTSGIEEELVAKVTKLTLEQVKTLH